jgi:acetate kinase
MGSSSGSVDPGILLYFAGGIGENSAYCHLTDGFADW